MKVIVRGVGEKTLTQKDFVAQGGQASVYVNGGVAYKVYSDPKDAIPESKFTDLCKIDDDAVIKPEHLITDPKGKNIGYTMKAVKDNHSLCQLFTRSFRDRNGISQDQIISLVEKLRGHIEKVHAAGILVVDLNELNILVSQSFDETFLIDVDSYQTKEFPATVIMPSVRDYSVSSKDFSALSDWFSFAVLSFQMFVGIHPYRGNHQPSAHLDKEARFLHRMRNHISVFQQDVTVPKCCYPLDQIPESFKDWLKAVLQDGKRLAPPSAHGYTAPTCKVNAVLQTIQGGNIVVTMFMDLEGWAMANHAEASGKMIISMTMHDGKTAFSTGLSKVMMNGRQLFSGQSNMFKVPPLVGFTPKMCSPIGFSLYGEHLTFYDYDRSRSEVLPFRVQAIAKSEERFYIKNGTQIIELEFAELVDRILVTGSHVVADVLEMASQLYEGLVIQSMLGSAFVSLFPASKVGYQVRIPELDTYKVMDAKFERGVLMVVGASKGKYDRLIMRFDQNYSAYDLRVVKDITPSGLNFIVTDAGVCVSVTEDEKIEAFSNKKDAKGMRVVEDPIIGNTMRLMRIGGKVGFSQGDRIYTMALK